MNEEFVTKSIINFLKTNGWTIFAFDYPQSGTGFLIHPNDRFHKTKEAIIPDIIANKESICIIMENKSYFYADDFIKLDELGNSEIYTNDLENLTSRLSCEKILYGIGLPNTVEIDNKNQDIINLADFIITVDKSKNCKYFSLKKYKC